MTKMAQQKLIFDEYVKDNADLANLFADRLIGYHLTKSQFAELFATLVPALPAQVSIEMRTPKGRATIYARGESLLSFALDHRAKLLWVS